MSLALSGAIHTVLLEHTGRPEMIVQHGPNNLINVQRLNGISASMFVQTKFLSSIVFIFIDK